MPRISKNSSHGFSVELKSKDYLKQVCMSNNAKDKVLIEGFLGDLKEFGFVEGVMLEIKGVNGILRLDFAEEELSNFLSKIGGRSQSKRMQ